MAEGENSTEDQAKSSDLEASPGVPSGKPSQAKAKAQPSEAKQEDEAPTFHMDALIRRAPEYFGEQSHIVAGALAGQGKKNFTIDEGKQLIKDWLKKPVEVEDRLLPAEERKA